MGAGELLPGEVAVVGTHGIGGGDGVVGQFIMLGNLAHQGGSGLPAGQLFAQKGVEHGAGGVEGLELVLHVQSLKDVLGAPHRQVGGVGVIGGAVVVGGVDVGELLLVVLGEAVGSGLCRGGLQIEEVTVLLLVVAQPLPHMTQHLHGEGLGVRVGQVVAQPAGVEPRLVHPHQANGGEVVAEGAQIVLGVGVEPVFHQLGDDLALGVQRAGGQVHELVQPPVKFLGGLGQIGDAGQVDGHHAHAAGGLPGAEVAPGLLAQLPQVQPQTAAFVSHLMILMCPKLQIMMTIKYQNYAIIRL